MGPRLCVYTCLTGKYEALNEQPIAASSRIPFICFTDDPDLRSETWQVRQVPRRFAMDPVRSQRAVKLQPHAYLPGFDASLYIDNSILLAQPPEALMERHFPASGFCIVAHSYRETVLAEFLEVAAHGLDDQSRIFEQLRQYLIDCPEVLQERPYWGGFLLRDHRSVTVRAMLDIWFAHVQRYSRRDQLSVNLAFRRAGLTPDVLRFDNFSSDYHSWPHRTGHADATRHSATALKPADLGVRALEIALAQEKQQNETLRAVVAQLDHALAEQRRRNDSLLSSTSWRMTAPLRRLAVLLRLGPPR